MKITIVGLGLIGGSIAKSLALSKKHEIYALDTDEQVLLDAISAGVIKNKATFMDLQDSEVVYLCMYPDGIVDFVETHKNDFGKSTIVTDVCGIKNTIYHKLKAVSEECGFTYIGAHPMAGKEVNTFASSDASLYYGASYIVIKDEGHAEEIAKLTLLAGEMGFGRIVFATPEEHDTMIAYTSQIPHVLACAYVMSPQCAKHKGFSAGSYRDVSRVAKINETLWTDLFLSNKEALVSEIEILEDNIDKLKKAIKEENPDSLRDLLAQARKSKEIYG